MGRKKAEAHGLSAGLWVRLPLTEAAKIRALVRKDRPLGVVLRELALAGLQLELQRKPGRKRRPAKTAPKAEGNGATT